MRGVQGSFLGYSLQEPYLLGCLNDRNELSLISAGQSSNNRNCQPLNVRDMRESERAQVIAGLPGGSLDDAIAQIEELARSSVLPVCPSPPPPARTTPAPLTPSPTVTPGEGASPRPGVPAPASSPTPAPETPTTVTSPAGPQPGSPAPPPPTTTAPTVTALPPPPPQPGTTCRAAA
jgi:protein phosphatase